jgi:hypothetical protein
MAAIYSNGGNSWNILGFNFTKRDALSSVYNIYMSALRRAAKRGGGAGGANCPGPLPSQGPNLRYTDDILYKARLHLQFLMRFLVRFSSI